MDEATSSLDNVSENALQKAIDKIFNSNKTIIAVIHRNLVNKYKEYGNLFWLEKENFDEIKKKILEYLL